MVASNNSPQSLPLNEQVPQQMRIGIEVTLDPESELSPSPVTRGPGLDNWLGLFYRVDVDALEIWAKNTNIMSVSFGCSVEEPEVTEDLRKILKIMYRNNWEPRVLRFTDTIIEKLKSLLTGFCKVTSRQRTVWCRHFNSWTPSQLQGHLLWLAGEEVIVEVEQAFEHFSR